MLTLYFTLNLRLNFTVNLSDSKRCAEEMPTGYFLGIKKSNANLLLILILLLQILFTRT